MGDKHVTGRTNNGKGVDAGAGRRDVLAWALPTEASGEQWENERCWVREDEGG
jgi:hypothetical protein